jgi:hypothetical protein
MFVAFDLLLPIGLKLGVIVRKIHNHVRSTLRLVSMLHTIRVHTKSFVYYSSRLTIVI